MEWYIQKLVRLIKLLVWILIIELAIPFAIGIWYSNCHNHKTEQVWLDQVIRHLCILRERCDDPELKNVLDYTIYRYNRIGGFDVMVLPCFSPPGYESVGLNDPLCPGVTIDPEVLTYSIHSGSMVLVHEACHDYWPYYHPFVDSLTDRVKKL